MNAVRQVICSALAPKAIGPYSQAIRVDKTVYISGQLGLNPETMNLAGDTVEQQAEQALKNLMNIIKEAGGDSKHVVKTTVLLASMDDFPKVNEIYAKYFSEPYPARMCFAVKTLPKNALVELDAVAVLDS